MASFLTNVGASGLTSGGGITFASDTIKARLVGSGATLDKDDTSLSPTTSFAIGTDYTLANKAKATDTANDRIKFGNGGTTLTWTAVAGGSTVGWIAIFKFVSNDAGSTPIAYIDVTDTATNGGDITYTEGSDALFYTQQ
jgi:hypothetical protein